MKVSELPATAEHRPRQHDTRRHSYLVCSCGGFDVRTRRGCEVPWFLWNRHLEEVGARVARCLNK